jgi:hypothetical protein
MNIKEEILKNIKNLNLAEYDQDQHGKGHYDNLSKLVCNLLNVGFSVEEVVKIIRELDINCKDIGMVSRWKNSIEKTLKNSNPTYSLWYFKKLLKCNFEGVEMPKCKVDVFAKLSNLKMKKDHKNFHSKIKEYFNDYELKHIHNNCKTFKNVGDFFKNIFPDIDKDKNMIGLVSNQNYSKGSFFNECKVSNKSTESLNNYTHFCLNRPYIRDKGKFEGVAEDDIFYARYMLIEVDEGLSIDEQIKLADILIDNGVPVKMVTHSGGKSVHIVIDLKIRVLEKLKQMNMLSGKHGVTNYCNIELRQLINGYSTQQIVEYFGTNNANDFYKEHIKSIYDILFAFGIEPDYSCKNLNRWTRIPNGIRIKDGEKVLQSLIYFREEDTDCIDTKAAVENFVKNTKQKIDSMYNSLFEL